MQSNQSPLRSARLAAGLLICLGLTLSLPAASQAGEGARLSEASGPVEVGRGEPPTWRDARAGEDLAPGDVVRTGSRGRAELALGGQTVRLYENSVLRLPSQAAGEHGPDHVELEQGRSLFDVLRRAPGRAPFEVRTPEVVVSVKGTRFAVDLDQLGDPTVSVFRGTVGVLAASAEAAAEVLVRQGFTARSGAAAAFELQLTPFDDPWGAWRSGGALPRVEAPTASQAALDGVREAVRTSVEQEMKHMDERTRELPVADRTRPGKRGRLDRSKVENTPPAAPAPDVLDRTDEIDITSEVEIDPVVDVRPRRGTRPGNGPGRLDGGGTMDGTVLDGNSSDTKVIGVDDGASGIH